MEKKNKYITIKGGVTAPLGFKASGISAGIKNGKKDMALIYSEVPANVAGVFTTNKVKAAPLLLTMDNLIRRKAQVVVINSGNANACTGEKGYRDAVETAKTAAEALNVNEKMVVVASTGVIGVNLPMDKVISGVKKAVENLSSQGGPDAAEAIMTTDTVSKEIALQIQIKDKNVIIGGMAKGSGMIHPNMATMLGFITTDASITSELLDKALKDAVNKSFNMITVDGDTSTNDMVVVLANGMAGNALINTVDKEYMIFKDALDYVCTYLARAIARDGEGATKFVEIRVRNAKSYDDAKKAARAVAGSNLVKTAIFGEDANWGRIIAAVGYSGADFDPGKVDIFLGDEQMAKEGTGLNFSEERAKEILSKDEVIITIDLNDGHSNATAWTCDLTYDYIKINADYRT